MIHLVLLAAGSSVRYGKRKQFVKIGNKKIWQWSLKKFIGFIDDAVVVVPKEELGQIDTTNYTIPVKIKSGGKTRLQSSYLGTKELNGGIVLIHDAARPLVSSELINGIIKKTETFGAAVPAIPILDTIKLTGGEKVVGTLGRNRYKAIQTPQGFETELIKKALENAVIRKLEITDDASAVEAMGKTVYITEGQRTNIKLTYKEDLKFIQQMLLELE